MGRLKTGITKLKRLITIDPLEDDEITWRAERTGLSKSEVHRQLRMLSYRGFDKKYGIGKFSPKKKKEEEKKAESDEEERRRKHEEEVEKAREEYWKKVLHDHEGSEHYGWQETGQ